MKLNKDICVANSVVKNTYMDYETKKLFYESCILDDIPLDILDRIKEQYKPTYDDIYKLFFYNGIDDLAPCLISFGTRAGGAPRGQYNNGAGDHYTKFSKEIYNYHNADEVAKYFPDSKKTYWKRKGWDGCEVLVKYLFLRYIKDDEGCRWVMKTLFDMDEFYPTENYIGNGKIKSVHSIDNRFGNGVSILCALALSRGIVSYHKQL